MTTIRMPVKVQYREEITANKGEISMNMRVLITHDLQINPKDFEQRADKIISKYGQRKLAQVERALRR